MKALFRNRKDVEPNKHPKHKEAYIQPLAAQQETGRVSVNFVTIKKGGELLPHTHEVLEVFYIIDGEGSLLLNGERQAVAGGSVIIAPPGEEHGLINTGDGELTLYAVFSPGIA